MAKKKWGKTHFELWIAVEDDAKLLLHDFGHDDTQKRRCGEKPMRQSHAGCNASKHHRQEITQFCSSGLI